MNFNLLVFSVSIFYLYGFIRIIMGSEGCLYETCNCTESQRSVDIICINKRANGGPFPKRNETYVPLKPIFIISLSNYKFKTIPDDAFKNLSIENLVFYENGLETLTSNAFRGVNSLESLTIFERLKKIEVDAFFFIRRNLTQLEISDANLTNTKMDAFISEIKALRNLNKLSLNNNTLTTISKDWIKHFENLEQLELNRNNLTKLPDLVFEFNSKLSSISLANNEFADLDAIVRSLEPIRNNSLSLFLSNNKFKEIKPHHFEKLVNLKHLGLANNQIEEVDEDSFKHNKELGSLSLENNYLKKIPHIRKLPNLIFLLLENQNGRLTELDDYAFERDIEKSLMYIHLDSNSFARIGNKSLCSRNTKSNTISSISIDYSSLKNMNKCILRQMRLIKDDEAGFIDIDVVLDEKKANLSQVCNCDMKVYLEKSKIHLVGACANVFNNISCKNERSVDTCANRVEYLCNSPYSTTTTAAITTTKLALKSRRPQNSNLNRACTYNFTNCCKFIFIYLICMLYTYSTFYS
jgi:Leucine-rich repeat (LRR) protein